MCNISSIFFNKCLYFSYYMAGYLLDQLYTHTHTHTHIFKPSMGETRLTDLKPGISATGQTPGDEHLPRAHAQGTRFCPPGSPRHPHRKPDSSWQKEDLQCSSRLEARVTAQPRAPHHAPRVLCRGSSPWLPLHPGAMKATTRKAEGSGERPTKDRRQAGRAHLPQGPNSCRVG